MPLERSTILAWRKLLASEEGLAGVLYLRESEPSIQKGPAESMIHDGGAIEGYKLCLERMKDLITLDTARDVKIEND